MAIHKKDKKRRIEAFLQTSFKHTICLLQFFMVLTYQSIHKQCIYMGINMKLIGFVEGYVKIVIIIE